MSTETKLQLKIFYFCLDLFNFHIRLFLVTSHFSNFPFSSLILIFFFIILRSLLKIIIISDFVFNLPKSNFYIFYFADG